MTASNTVTFAGAFSFPTTHRRPIDLPRQNTCTTNNICNSRQLRRQSTQLNETPVNTKKILGPISPSTLEKYNLPPDVISQGYAVQIVTQVAGKSIDESTEIQLAPKNTKEHYVDTVKVEIPISLDSPSGVGLGVELLEIEGGGRDDGLGIVIVNGLVPGGNAERAMDILKNEGKETIMYGDSLSSVDLILRRVNRANGETMDVSSARTECLGYDSMVESLMELLSPLSNNQRNINEATVILTLRRLRRSPQIQIQLHYPPSQKLPPTTLQLKPGDNLRMAMLQRGIKLNDPLAQRYDGKPTGSGNCGSGGLCRTCAISVRRGGDLLSPPKQNEEKMLQETRRWRLACKSWVGYGMKEGEVVIDVNPRQW